MIDVANQSLLDFSAELRDCSSVGGGGADVNCSWFTSATKWGGEAALLVLPIGETAL